MENTKNIGEKSFHVLKWISIIMSALAVILYWIFIGSISEQMGNFGNMFQAFFQTNGLFVAFFLIFLLGMMFAKDRRELLSKIAVWAMVILGIAITATFFTSDITQLAMYPFSEVFGMISGYAPKWCAIVALITLIIQWDTSDKKTTNIISMICSIVAVFMTAYYLFRYMEIGSGYTVMEYVNILWTITTFVAIALVSVIIYMLSQSRKIFDKAIFGLTDEEARIAEEVEDRVEAMVADMEEDLVKDAAIDLIKEEATEEAIAELDEELEEAELTDDDLVDDIQEEHEDVIDVEEDYESGDEEK